MNQSEEIPSRDGSGSICGVFDIRAHGGLLRLPDPVTESLLDPVPESNSTKRVMMIEKVRACEGFEGRHLTGMSLVTEFSQI